MYVFALIAPAGRFDELYQGAFTRFCPSACADASLIPLRDQLNMKRMQEQQAEFTRRQEEMQRQMERMQQQAYQQQPQQPGGFGRPQQPSPYQQQSGFGQQPAQGGSGSQPLSQFPSQRGSW